MRRFLMIFFSIIIILFLVIYLLVYTFQEKLMFYPEKLPDNFMFQFDEPHSEINLKSSTGNTINCLLFKAGNSRGIILYFHGNAGSLRTWGNVASDFLPLQYD